MSSTNSTSRRSATSGPTDSRGGRGSRGRGNSRGGRGHKFQQPHKRPEYVLYRREQLPIYPRQIYQHHTFASLLHTTYASFRGRREQLRKAQERIDKLARRRARYGDPTKNKLTLFADPDLEQHDHQKLDSVDADNDNLPDDPRERRRRALAKTNPPSIRQQLFGATSATDHTADLVGGVDLEALHAMDQADWRTLEALRAELLADLFDPCPAASAKSAVVEPAAQVAQSAPQPLLSMTSSRTSQLSHIHKRSTLVATGDNKHDWIVRASPFPMFAHHPPVRSVALSALPAYDTLAQRVNAAARARREAARPRAPEDKDHDAMSVDDDDDDTSDDSDDQEEQARLQLAVNHWVPPVASTKSGKVVQVDGVSGKVKSGAKWLPKAAGITPRVVASQ